MRQKLSWRPNRRQLWLLIGLLALLTGIALLQRYLGELQFLTQPLPPFPVFLVLFAVIVALGILTVIVGGYRYSWKWTGFAPKTLWDWVKLVGTSAVIGVATIWFNVQNDNIAADNRRETALESYIDKMSDLLLDKGLGTSNNEEIQNVARTRTLTVLRNLDGERKGLVLRFIYDSHLITETTPIVFLGGADLTSADLRYAYLRDANLSGTYLTNADLSKANLSGANLDGADLRYAYLRDANLSGADLSGADLSGAKVTPEQLAKVKSLKGTIRPDGTKHD